VRGTVKKIKFAGDLMKHSYWIGANAGSALELVVQFMHVGA